MTAAKFPHPGGGALLIGNVGDDLFVRWCIPRSMLAWLLEPGREDDDMVAITCDGIRVEVSSHADAAAAKRAADDIRDKLALAAASVRGAA